MRTLRLALLLLAGLLAAVPSRRIEGEDLININTASREELETLSGIGPVKASSIIEFRENVGLFEAIEDIQKVRGIGPKTFASNRHRITVGAAFPAATAPASPPPERAESEKININTAAEQDLTALSGIGPAKARAIVEYRENAGGFRTIEDFMNVGGIGPNTFQANRDRISVGEGLPVPVVHEKRPEPAPAEVEVVRPAPPPPVERRPDKPKRLSPAFRFRRGELNVLVLDVEKGNAVILGFPDGSFGLVNAGGSAAAERVKQALKTLGVAELVVVVLSTPIPENISGLPAVMKALPVRAFWDSGQNARIKAYRSILGLCLKRNVKYLQPQRGHRSTWGGAEVEVLHPKTTRFTRPEDNSLVFRLRFGEFSMLFPGDVGEEAERAIVRTTAPKNLHCTVFKAAAGGSPRSNSLFFLRALDPALVVISCGASEADSVENTVRRLKAEAIPVKRTDLSGSILITSNGKGHRVVSER